MLKVGMSDAQVPDKLDYFPNPYRSEPERTRWNEGYTNARG